MINYSGRVVLLGYGAIGKSLHSIMSHEIKLDFRNLFVIDMTDKDKDMFIELGGVPENFIKQRLTQKNYAGIFEKLLRYGDLLIDVTSCTGTKDFARWCAENNVMFINTGDGDWEDAPWRTLIDHFEENTKLMSDMNVQPQKNLCPVVFQCGANPGLVSMFVKEALEYIVINQMPKNPTANQLLRNGQWANLAEYLGVSIIHSSDNDTQLTIIPDFDPNCLYSTWSPSAYFVEALQRSEFYAGTNELKGTYSNEYKLDIPYCKKVSRKHRVAELYNLGTDRCIKSFSPAGVFTGGIIVHDESLTIPKFLSVYTEEGKLIYSPTTVFVYSPCKTAREFWNVGTYNPSQLPKKVKVLYDEISEGTEYVGVFIVGEKFKPVWVGNSVPLDYARKWGRQNTPTILQVSATLLASICWMIRNQHRKGVFFPEFIDHKFVIGQAEKYITKTQYITVNPKQLDIPIDYTNILHKQFLVKREEAE